MVTSYVQGEKKVNARQLAMRDPAYAALMGATVQSGISGSDFGSIGGQADFGSEFGDEDDDFGFGSEFGDDDDFGSEAVVTSKPTQRQALAAWKRHAVRSATAQKRTQRLDPNRNSTAKVERYVFPMSTTLVIGTASNINLNEQPDTTFRAQIVTMNAPTPGFVTITTMQMANVSISVGPGLQDAYDYNANGWGRSLDAPTLQPSNRARVTGRYTGFIPPGFTDDMEYEFCVTFKGPSSMAGAMAGV